MASRKGVLLDPAQQHILTEQECELIAVFRMLSKPKRESILRSLLQTVMILDAQKEERATKG